jgi:hypothetical protein
MGDVVPGKGEAAPAMSKPRRHRASDGKGALESAEEAVHLLRQAPFRVWAAYAIGTVPFVLGLLYFWADMSRSAYASSHAVGAALGLALAFVWMKSWQAVFAGELRASLAGAPPPVWSWRRLARLVLVQTALQPHGLAAIPAALCMAFPFHAVYAFFQNVTVLGDGSTSSLRETVRHAWRQALLWPRQNHVLIWLLSPWLLGAGMLVAFGGMWMALGMMPELHEVGGIGWFLLAIVVMFNLVMPVAPLGCVVAGNVAALLVGLPVLWQAFTGQQTVFALSGLHAFVNTTFLMTVFGLSYLILDPLAKAAYVLRCFYGDALTTGEDLRASLRPLRRAAPSGRLGVWLVAGGLAVLATVTYGQAQPPAGQPGGPLPPPTPSLHEPAAPVDADLLDRVIDDVLARPEYAWRMPREGLLAEGDGTSLWAEFFRKLAHRVSELLGDLVRLLRKLARWLERLLPERDPTDPGNLGWQSPVQTFLFIVLALSASVLALLLLRAWKRRHAPPRAVAAVPVVTAETLLRDEVVADQLPSDEWMALARELLARGETRLALRAMFLGAVAHLAHAGRLSVARGKSNRDYRRELERKAHDLPEVLEAFIQNVGLVERVWYGSHPATEELVAVFQSNQRRILGRAALPPVAVPGGTP